MAQFRALCNISKRKCDKNVSLSKRRVSKRALKTATFDTQCDKVDAICTTSINSFLHKASTSGNLRADKNRGAFARRIECAHTESKNASPRSFHRRIIALFCPLCHRSETHFARCCTVAAFVGPRWHAIRNGTTAQHPNRCYTPSDASKRCQNRCRSYGYR